MGTPSLLFHYRKIGPFLFVYLYANKPLKHWIKIQQSDETQVLYFSFCSSFFHFFPANTIVDRFNVIQDTVRSRYCDCV